MEVPLHGVRSLFGPLCCAPETLMEIESRFFASGCNFVG